MRSWDPKLVLLSVPISKSALVVVGVGTVGANSFGFSSDPLSSVSFDVSPVESAVTSGVDSDSDSSGKSSTIRTGAGGGAFYC